MFCEKLLGNHGSLYLEMLKGFHILSISSMFAKKHEGSFAILLIVSNIMQPLEKDVTK
jgi:hypothetical protein